MRFTLRHWKLGLSIFIILNFLISAHTHAEDTLLMAYGGITKPSDPIGSLSINALYQKHGIDALLLQVRNAQISLTALVSGEVPIFLPSIANVLSGVSTGAKISCVAFPIKGISRELVARKDIDFLGNSSR
jgi:hypothetical protein